VAFCWGRRAHETGLGGTAGDGTAALTGELATADKPADAASNRMSRREASSSLIVQPPPYSHLLFSVKITTTRQGVSERYLPILPNESSRCKSLTAPTLHDIEDADLQGPFACTRW
jgi:hypothetical protein